MVGVCIGLLDTWNIPSWLTGIGTTGKSGIKGHTTEHSNFLPTL